MKLRWIFWWIVNAIWIFIFTGLSLIILLREIDGSGVKQTPELRLLSFAILLIAFIFPLIKQVIWLVINLITENHQRNTN